MSRTLSNKALKSRFFKIDYSPKLETNNITTRILEQNQHPLGRMIKDRLDSRDKDSLWQCFSAHSWSLSPVMSHKACRKVRLAFTEAMSENGYTRFGKPLEGKGDSLRGTIEVMPRPAALLAPPSVLKMEMREVVKYLKGRQKSDMYQSGRK